MTTYKVSWTDEIATVTWDDGAEQMIVLNIGDRDLLEQGHDPVAEGWEDGCGNAVCRANATIDEDCDAVAERWNRRAKE